MSGLSYDMVRCWPLDLFKEVYDILVGLWKEREIPSSWRLRWVQLIPKIDEPTLADLRPLCLLEVVRKLWTKIFVKRITDFFATKQIMSQGQHCGRGKGTDSGAAETLAVMMTAKAYYCKLYMSSWDIRRAFDSVAKFLLQFSLIRLGVPEELAGYISSMDRDAVMFIKSPLAILVHQEGGTEALTELKMGFLPDRGTPQGAGESPLLYMAFNDILICALKAASKGEDYYRITTTDVLGEADDISYVDDLISCAGSRDEIQIKSDVVSAFASITDVELNTSKFRAFGLNFGNEHGQETNESIIVHSKNWTPASVRLAWDGTVVNLGSKKDCNLDDAVQYRETEVALAKMMAAVGAGKHFGTGVRGSIIKNVIAKRIGYVANKASWALQGRKGSYEALDKIFFRGIRKATDNMYSSPERLITMSKFVYASEFKSISDAAQEDKLANMAAAYREGGARAITMDVILAQVLRAAGQSRIGPCTVQSIAECDTTYFSSALSSLQREGLTLSFNCPRGLTTVVQVRMLYPSMANKSVQTLYTYCITTVPELFMGGDPYDAILSPLIQAEGIAAWRREPIWGRAGQVWLIQTAEADMIYQLHGVLPSGEWSCIQWFPVTKQRAYVGSTLVTNGGVEILRGAGGNLSVNESAFRSGVTYLLTASVIKNLTSGRYSTRILGQRPRLLRQRAIPVLNPVRHDPVRAFLATEACAVYTDATHTREQTGCEWLLNEGRVVSRGGLVKDDGFGGYPHLIVETESLRHDSAYPCEQFMQIVALNYSDQPVCRTDCLASAKMLQKQIKSKSRKQDLRIFHRPDQGHRLGWCKGHPEYIEPDCMKWSPEQKGIEKADRVAGREWEQYSKNNCDTSGIVVTDTAILKELARELTCPFISDMNGLISFEDPLDKRRARQWLEYCLLRDKSAEKFIFESRGPRFQWVGTSMRLVWELFKGIHGKTRVYQMQRIVYNKNWIGTNKYKGSKLPTDLHCSLCGAGCEDQQHVIWHCTHEAMMYVREVMWKKICESVEIRLSGKPSHTARAIARLHHVLSVKANYPLLCGVVHAVHRKVLDNVLGDIKEVKKKVLLAHWRQYGAMVLALYSTRNSVVSTKEGTWKRTSATKPFVLARRALRGLEVVSGIERFTVVDPTGRKITSNRKAGDEALFAGDRTILTAMTSLPERELELHQDSATGTKGKGWSASVTTAKTRVATQATVARQLSQARQMMVQTLNVIAVTDPSTYMQFIPSSAARVRQCKRMSMDQTVAHLKRPMVFAPYCNAAPVKPITQGYIPFNDRCLREKAYNTILTPEKDPYVYTVLKLTRVKKAKPADLYTPQDVGRAATLIQAVARRYNARWLFWSLLQAASMPIVNATGIG